MKEIKSDKTFIAGTKLVAQDEGFQFPPKALGRLATAYMSAWSAFLTIRRATESPLRSREIN
jgi:hypothetical protein